MKRRPNGAACRRHGEGMMVALGGGGEFAVPVRRGQPCRDKKNEAREKCGEAGPVIVVLAACAGVHHVLVVVVLGMRGCVGAWVRGVCCWE
jgi:hypothetical protein